MAPRFSDELTPLSLADDNIDETYGVNVQFESDEEVRGDERLQGGSGGSALSPRSQPLCRDHLCPVLLGHVGKWALARAGMSLPGKRSRIILDAASWLGEDLLIILLIQGLS